MTVSSTPSQSRSVGGKTYSRSSRAQSIIETIVGIMFLVPIVLFLFDVAVVVLCNTANDNLAKSACRAAASATDSSKTPAVGTSLAASAAAAAVCKNFAPSTIIRTPNGQGDTDGSNFLTGFFFNTPGDAGSGGAPALSGTPNPLSGQVAVITTMNVLVPVPFPFLPDKFSFQAKDVEPVVSVAP